MPVCSCTKRSRLCDIVISNTILDVNHQPLMSRLQATDIRHQYSGQKNPPACTIRARPEAQSSFMKNYTPCHIKPARHDSLISVQDKFHRGLSPYSLAWCSRQARKFSMISTAWVIACRSVISCLSVLTSASVTPGLMSIGLISLITLIRCAQLFAKVSGLAYTPLFSCVKNRSISILIDLIAVK